MRPYIDMTDEQLTAEIKAMTAAVRKAAEGGIAVVQGEGRRVEYTRSNIGALNAIVRDLGYEARQRGLAIGGRGGAIAVEIG